MQSQYVLRQMNAVSPVANSDFKGMISNSAGHLVEHHTSKDTVGINGSKKHHEQIKRKTQQTLNIVL